MRFRPPPGHNPLPADMTGVRVYVIERGFFDIVDGKAVTRQILEVHWRHARQQTGDGWVLASCEVGESTPLTERPA